MSIEFSTHTVGEMKRFILAILFFSLHNKVITQIRTLRAPDKDTV